MPPFALGIGQPAYSAIALMDITNLSARDLGHPEQLRCQHTRGRTFGPSSTHPRPGNRFASIAGYAYGDLTVLSVRVRGISSPTTNESL